MSDVGLNRQLVRAIYPKVDWDEYDREVVAESLPDYKAAVEILAAFMELPSYHGDGCFIRSDLQSCDCGVQRGRIEAKAALRRLYPEVPA